MTSNKPIILIFVDWFIPAFKAGGPIRSVYNLTDQLSDIYDFRIVTGDRDLKDSKPYPGLELNKWLKVGDTDVIYLSKKNLKIKTLKNIIEEVKPQVIYLNSLFSFNFSLIPLWLKKKHPYIKFVLAPRGMLGIGALEIKKKKKEVFIGLARMIKLYNGIVWHATNKKEKKEIEKVFGKKHNVLIADNIATAPKYSYQTTLKMKLIDFETKRFLFVSRISRKKNVEKLIQWFIDLSADKKCFKLLIIGTIEDPVYFKELQTLIGDNKQINIKDAIRPKELAKIYAKSHFFCLPTRHENFGHVIIEALSYGCPVIISQKTPWRHLKKENIGWDLPLEKPEKFLAVLNKCIDMDAETYLHMSESSSMFAHDFIYRKEVINAYRKLLAT
jgi:glycosyltransferase involved in cell wall biosynthesis